jgi:hypothetical protein
MTWFRTTFVAPGPTGAVRRRGGVSGSRKCEESRAELHQLGEEATSDGDDNPLFSGSPERDYTGTLRISGKR